MELDIPRGTLCSHAEASSLLPSKVGHLLTVSSLTAALRASGKDFSVEPVYLGLTKGAENGDEIFVRDVLLKLDGETVIQARSACRPDSRLWTELLDCGTQPLGERLLSFFVLKIPTIHLSDGLLPRAVRISIGTAKYWN